jgi:hypothetical protein
LCKLVQIMFVWSFTESPQFVKKIWFPWAILVSYKKKHGGD